ncbi:MAG: hypothetical protein AB7O44_15430 [Hyphomicrobiaceae bacterium]
MARIVTETEPRLLYVALQDIVRMQPKIKAGERIMALPALQRSRGKGLSEQAKKRKAKGTRTRLSLLSLAGLLQEAGVVYRQMKAGTLEHDKGRSLVWVLAQMRAMLEAQHLERIEDKLDKLAQTAEAGGMYHGHTGATREARLPN